MRVKAWLACVDDLIDGLIMTIGYFRETGGL